MTLATTVRLVRGEDEHGPHYTVAGPSAVDGGYVDLPFAEALHSRIHPLGAAEGLLRAASGDPVATEGIPEDPTAMTPTRIRAGAVIIRDGLILLIRLDRGDEPAVYEIPGGGIEADETSADAIRREIREETGLDATPGRQIARVWRTSARVPGLFLDHYHLAEASGEFGAIEDLDLEDGRPVWVPVTELPELGVWPRRLRWRIAYWHEHGWPERPVDLADRNVDLHLPCRW